MTAGHLWPVLQMWGPRFLSPHSEYGAGAMLWGLPPCHITVTHVFRARQRRGLGPSSGRRACLSWEVAGSGGLSVKADRRLGPYDMILNRVEELNCLLSGPPLLPL